MERRMIITHNGVEYIGQTARIKSTMLGYEDHGIFTASLGFEGAGWEQSTSGYFYDEDDGNGARRGRAFGTDQIMKILGVLNANSWEEVKDRQVIVLRTEDYGPIVGIAHPIKERILIFQEHAEAWADR